MRWEFAERGLVVDPARSDDARALWALRYGVLSEGAFFITQGHEFRDTLDDERHRIQQLGEASNSIYLVARGDDGLLGMLTAHGGQLERMRHTAKIEVMVSEQARRRGVGRALMEACLDWARQHPQLVKLGLSVFADNEAAAKLYAGFGFQEEGRRLREYRMADGSYRDDRLLYLFVNGTDQTASS